MGGPPELQGLMQTLRFCSIFKKMIAAMVQYRIFCDGCNYLRSLPDGLSLRESCEGGSAEEAQTNSMAHSMGAPGLRDALTPQYLSCESVAALMTFSRLRLSEARKE